MADYFEQLSRAIAFIEERLGEDIGFRDIAAQAAYLSPWHFLRVFEAMLGLSPAEYLRERRLSVAAFRLVESDARILDIALDARYESQEAFTRAFKRRYGAAPGRYRERGTIASYPSRKPFSIEDLRLMTKGICMEPTIVRKDAFTVIGIAGPSSQSDNRIPALWRKFMAREEEVTDRAPGGGGYGICGYLDASTMDEDTEWEELVGDEVLDTAQPPAGMVKRTIAAGRYAVFTHKGGVESIGATYQYIYGTYIPRSGLTLAKVPDFEYYDGRFKPETPEESEMFIYIPLAD